MPSEITHIAHAQRFLRLHPEYDYAEFLSGTVFPDIRVLGVVERYQTHAIKPGLPSVLGMKNSWWAGFLFHRYLDLQWDAWCRGYGVEPTDPVQKAFSNAVKLLGDVALYGQVGDPRDTATWLWPVRDEELGFGISAEAIEYWHGIIAGYLLAGPSRAALRKLLRAQHNSAAWVDEVDGYLRYIEATPLWRERVKGFEPAYE